MISARTRVFGVLGHPVGHSLSPAMHNAAFREAGLDAVYVALPVSPERLPEALRGAHALGLAGLNVTVPHKQAAAAQCLQLAPSALACGAANTLVRAPDGAAGWTGHNTDAPALRALLAEAGVGPGAPALLLGAGGAARAAAWALLDLGAELTVAARRREAAAELCRTLRASFPASRCVAPPAWEELSARTVAAAVVVNATSIGLAGGGDELSALAFRPGQVVADFVYGDTLLARRAAGAGARVVTGEQLLVRQGALAFTLWTGRPAPEATMAGALRAATAPEPA